MQYRSGVFPEGCWMCTTAQLLDGPLVRVVYHMSDVIGHKTRWLELDYYSHPNSTRFIGRARSRHLLCIHVDSVLKDNLLRTLANRLARVRAASRVTEEFVMTPESLVAYAQELWDGGYTTLHDVVDRVKQMVAVSKRSDRVLFVTDEPLIAELESIVTAERQDEADFWRRAKSRKSAGDLLFERVQRELELAHHALQKVDDYLCDLTFDQYVWGADPCHDFAEFDSSREQVEEALEHLRVITPRSSVEFDPSHGYVLLDRQHQT